MIMKASSAAERSSTRCVRPSELIVLQCRILYANPRWCSDGQERRVFDVGASRLVLVLARVKNDWDDLCDDMLVLVDGILGWTFTAAREDVHGVSQRSIVRLPP